MAFKNKEDEREYQKKYRIDNKEKIANYNKAWRASNKDKVIADKKVWKDSHKDGLYTVYLLSKENYVGMTTNLYMRLARHKSEHSRDVSDVKILGKYNTRDEARAVEDRYHDNGFKGAYGFKQRMEEFNKPEAIARRKEIEKELLLIGKKFNLI
tara:strand:- start:164 stop:625 length:462 start_codon:yes stop_codon:yes gene_type:complete